jgi:hypothetical protein
MSFNPNNNPAYSAPGPAPARPDGIKPRIVGPNNWQGQFVNVNGYGRSTFNILASSQDDLDREIGPDTYDRMENDPTVTKIKSILITGATSDELQLAPGMNEEEAGGPATGVETSAVQSDDFQRFAYVQAFCQAMLDGLERPYRGYLAQMMRNAIPHGHAIGETEWEYRRANIRAKGGPSSISAAPTTTGAKIRHAITTFLSGRGLRTFLSASLRSKLAQPAMPTPTPTVVPGTDGQTPARKQPSVFLMPVSIRVKPHGAALFVVDDYMTTLGIVPRNRVWADLKPDEAISRDKFIVLTMNERNNDPRGRSEYRPIYSYWHFKQHIPKEYLLFLLQEAVPSAVGTLPENLDPYEFDRGPSGEIVYEDDVFDQSGQPIPKMLTASESMARQIKDFRSGSGAVIPHDAKLEPFRTGQAQDDVFANAISTADRQMENGVLLQPLAQSEGEHQARSAAQEHANILFLKHFSNRWGLAMMTLFDLLAVGVRMNLGDWALAYMPKISLGDSAPRDWAKEFGVMADAYFKGLVDDTQRPAIMADFGMPKPGPSARQQAIDAGQSPPNPTQDQRSGTPNPAAPNRPDKQPGQNNAAYATVGLSPGPWNRKQYASYRAAR